VPEIRRDGSKARDFSVTPAGEEEGMDLATDELRAMRKERLGEGGT
jgi:hypothetical protein